jgi:alpha-tubulin suppressor-like RCC1 family protein
MRLGILVALLSLVACIRPSKVVGVSCESASDCVLGATMGTCEPTSFCSYPDADCTSGSRYSPGAGMGLGGTCVGGSSGCGAQGEACCGNVCGANLACDDTSKTCVCGENAQPCCGGDTCGANLACLEGAMCACGGIGQPCCGGTACDAGVTCSAGTCSAGATQIAVGMGHACALRPDRTVWCWGNDYKPWAQTTPGLLTPTIGTSTPRPIADATNVVEIRAGEEHTCARKMDGTLWCWGHNENGQLGIGTNTSSKIAVQVMGLTNVTKFDGGRRHTCAVGSYNGTQGVFCWGRNSSGDRASGTPDPAFGRLGNDSVTDSNVPVAVDLSMAANAGQTVRSLSTGGYHSCMAMSDNKVWCWGRGTGGQLGDNAATSSKVPVQVDFSAITLGGATVDEVTCSDGSGFASTSTCMRVSTGDVYCWGSGTAAGDGTTTQRNRPTAAVTTTALGAATFTQLATPAGDTHCGLTSAGDVWCWGSNRQGILGINDYNYGTTSSTPAKTLALTGATQLDMSHRTACAVDNAQRVWCWGSNRRGQARTEAAYVPQPTRVAL